MHGKTKAATVNKAVYTPEGGSDTCMKGKGGTVTQQKGTEHRNYVVVVVFLEILECMTWSPFGDWEAGFLSWR